MKPGDVIEGRYLIEALLGEGGMARVFRVRHVGLGSVHALKVLNADLADRVEVRTRFASEGQIQAQIRHPNIVAVTEVVSEPGLQGLVMDFVEGQPLDAYLATLKAPPSFEVVQAFMLPVLDAMALAHQRGIVHRDLKPENILVGRDGQGRPWPRVTDFGIAKVKQEAHSGRATRTGTSMGTRGYMSPEQIKSSKDVNARSDIFSLGATLYELATLKQAFAGESDYEVMDRIVHETYPPPEQVFPGIDARVAQAITRALRADPEARFSTCEEFAGALAGSGFSPVRAPTAAPTEASPQALARAPTGVRHDTRPDVPLAVLDVLTFAPLAGLAAEPANVALSDSVLEPAPVSRESTAAAWAAVEVWTASWPEPLRKSMRLVDVMELPVHRLRVRATFERRDCRVRDVAFPAAAIPPPEGAPRDDIEPFGVVLPITQVEEGRVETFVVAGTVVVRACTACRGHGNITCGVCGGAASARCVTCSGSGAIECVLCDGTGAVPKLGGDGLTLCPSCRGTNRVACGAPACEGGQVRCAECQGKGTQPCHFCSGAGSVARATVLSRATRSAHGHALVEYGLGDTVRALAETMPGPGEAVASFRLGAPRPQLDPRLASFVERADLQATQSMVRWGPGWQITRRTIDLHRVPVLGLRYEAGGGEHQVHLVGAGLEVIGLPAALEGWRQVQADRVVELARKQEFRELKRLDLASAFEPADSRLTDASQKVSQLAIALWDRGDVAEAQALRAALPEWVAGPTRVALQPREEQLLGEGNARRRRHLLGAAVSLVAALITGAAYYSLGGTPSCHLAGVWGKAGSNVTLQVTLELGSMVRGVLRGATQSEAPLTGTCDAATHSLMLKGTQGTLSGTVGPGRSLEAAWTPAIGTRAGALELPMVPVEP